jgi:uncharacterized protein (TIGR04255 family)
MTTATERPASLPDYHKPPIDEVVVGVQFPAIEGLHDILIREFWRIVQDEYPILERQPRLEGSIESLAAAQQLTIQLPTPGILPQSRMWMISDADDFLIQVQNTRFIQNWRRRQDEYGHFEEVREKFWKNFNKFRDFVRGQGLSMPEVQQIEVTYLNWIPEVPMSDFLRPATSTRVHIFGADQMPEDQNLFARYLIPNDIDVVERLYVQCAPAIRPQTPDIRGTQLGLIFRAARESGLSNEEADMLIGSGRVLIVEAFTELTTPAAHELWERYK